MNKKEVGVSMRQLLFVVRPAWAQSQGFKSCVLQAVNSLPVKVWSE
jgi:hypothetical protein